MRHHAFRVLIAVTVLLFIGCGKDDPNTPENEDSVVNTLTFLRQDLSPILMGDLYRACCDTLVSGPGDEPGMVFQAFAPNPETAGWILTIVLDSVTPETSYSLPTPSVGFAPVHLFIFDAPTGNELNSDGQGGSGTFYVHGVSCGPPATVDITMNAVVPSEFSQGPPVKVDGRIKARLVNLETGPCD